MKSYFDHLGRKVYRVLKADPKEAIAKTNVYLSSPPMKISSWSFSISPDTPAPANCSNFP